MANEYKTNRLAYDLKAREWTALEHPFFYFLKKGTRRFRKE